MSVTWLAVPVEDRFDVVPVRINDERCVVPGVVMRAKTRRAVVATAGFDSLAVELVNGSSVGCCEGSSELSTTVIPNGSRARRATTPFTQKRLPSGSAKPSPGTLVRWTCPSDNTTRVAAA